MNRALVLRHFLSLHGCIAPVRWGRAVEQDCCGGPDLSESRFRPITTSTTTRATNVSAAVTAIAAGARGGPGRGVMGGRLLPPPGADVHLWKKWQALPSFDWCLEASGTSVATGTGGGRGPGDGAAVRDRSGGEGAGGGGSRVGFGGAGAVFATEPVGVHVDLRNMTELRRIGVFELLPADARASMAALSRWLQARS